MKSKKKSKKHSKLHLQLIIVFLVLSLTPALCLTLITSKSIHSMMNTTVGSYSQKIVDQLTNNINQAIRATNLAIGKVINSHDVSVFVSIANRDSSDGDLYHYKFNALAYIDSILLADPYIHSLYLVNKDDILLQKQLSSYTNTNGVFDYLKNDFASSTLYTDLVEGHGTQWVTLQVGEMTSPEIFAINKFGFDDDPTFIVCGIQSNFFSTLFKSSNINDSTEIMLVDNNQSIILSTHEESSGKSVPTYLSDFLTSETYSDDKSFTSTTSSNTLVSMAMLENYWSVIMDAPLTVLLSEVTSTNQLIIQLMLVLIVIVLLISTALSIRITSPLKKMAIFLQKVEKGDLTIIDHFKNDIHVSNAETSLLHTGFISMLTTLRSIIEEASNVTSDASTTMNSLNVISTNTATSATQVQHSIDSIAIGAQDQAAATDTSLTLMDDLSSQINHVGDMINSVHTSSNQTIAMSTSTNKHLEALRTQTLASLSTAESINRHVKDLGEEANNINQIVSLITSINKQTNLLALNASIEAARAGDAGRGFAVVAEEVRVLSNQIQSAIQTIQGTVSTIHSKKDITLNEMSHAIEIFNNQLPVVDLTVNAFLNIQEQMNDVNNQIDHVTNVLSGVQEQKNVIHHHLNDISEIIQTAASIAEEVSAESEEQTSYSYEINNMTSQLTDNLNALHNTYNRFTL